MSKNDGKYQQVSPKDIQNPSSVVISQIQSRTTPSAGYYGEPLAEVKGLGMAQAANTKGKDVDKEVEDRTYIAPLPQLSSLSNEPKEEPAMDDKTQLLSPREKYLESGMVADANIINEKFKKGGSPGGTTAMRGIVDAKTQQVTYANVGDGRVILFTRKGEKVEIERKNTLHNLENEQEKKRIQGMGGTIENNGEPPIPYLTVEVELKSEDDDYSFAPKRKAKSGIAVSRAWGDVHFTEAGLSSIPQIGTFDIDPTQDQYVLFCTDGFDEEELAKNHPEELQKLLLQIFDSTEDTATKSLWLVKFAKQYSLDDGTCILIDVKTFCKQISLPPSIVINLFDGHINDRVAFYAQILSKERLDIFSITEQTTLWSAAEEKSLGKLKFLLQDNQNPKDQLWTLVPHKQYHVDDKDPKSRTALEIVLCAEGQESEKILVVTALLRDYKASTAFVKEKKSKIFTNFLRDAEALSPGVTMVSTQNLPKLYPAFRSELTNKNYIYYLSVAASHDIYNVHEQDKVEFKQLFQAKTKAKAIAHLQHLGVQVDADSIGYYRNNQGYAFFTSEYKIPQIEAVIDRVNMRIDEFKEINDILTVAQSLALPTSVKDKINLVYYTFRRCCAHKVRQESLTQFNTYLTDRFPAIGEEKELLKLKTDLQAEVNLELRLGFKYICDFISAERQRIYSTQKYNPNYFSPEITTLLTLKTTLRTVCMENRDIVTVLKKLVTHIETEHKLDDTLNKEFKHKFLSSVKSVIQLKESLKPIDEYIEKKISEDQKRALKKSSPGLMAPVDEKSVSAVKTALIALQKRWNEICFKYCPQGKDQVLKLLIAYVNLQKQPVYETHLKKFSEDLISIAYEQMGLVAWLGF